MSAPFTDLSCNSEDVLHTIQSLRRCTASGPDEISAIMLKICSPSICSRLACIFNSSSSSGMVPKEWKVSRVTPVFKKGDAGLVNNYRPISLLSLVGKLQERLVHNVLLRFLLECNAISPCQFGFRLGSSQEALVSATQSWHQSLEEGNSAICIFLNLSNAFDTVPHCTIVEALSQAGVAGSPLAWFKDYLSDRSQYVVVQGSSFLHSKVTSGVPQGSILGPLLFIMALMRFFVFLCLMEAA